MHIPEDEAERRRLNERDAKSCGERTALCVRIVRMAM